MKDHHINCEDFQNMLMIYEILEENERALLDEHLAQCKECAEHLEMTQIMEECFTEARLPDGESGMDITERVMAEINRKQPESSFPLFHVLLGAILLQITMLFLFAPTMEDVRLKTEQLSAPVSEQIGIFTDLIAQSTQVANSYLIAETYLDSVINWMLIIAVLLITLGVNLLVFMRKKV